MSDDDFGVKFTKLVRSDSLNGQLGIKRSVQYHTKAGVSSLISNVYFLEDVDEADLNEIPDYIISDTIEADLMSTVSVCAEELRNTKYFPSRVKISEREGYSEGGERNGACIDDWEDFSIIGADGEILYSHEELEEAKLGGQNSLGTALWLIVKDICDSGEFLSENWYQAKILHEYFKTYPVSSNSAFLIGELFKELCSKQMFEGDLGAYFQSLEDAKSRRKTGAKNTKAKAEELRSYCVELFIEIAKNRGARVTMVPDDVKATELRRVALERRPADFLYAGKPYSKEWFLRHIFEDRRLEIIKGMDKDQPKKAEAF